MKSGGIVLFSAVCAVFMLSITCAEKQPAFKPIIYFPIQPGNTWQFSGSISKIEISVESSKDNEFQMIYYDTLNTALWAERYVLQDSQIYWKTFEPNIELFPRISFSPPLPYAPISDKLEFSTNMLSTETQTDSSVRRSQIRIDYQIKRVESVMTPAAIFKDCLMMKISISYLDVTASPVFAGEHVWWYAKGVGPIKYELPSAEGELLSYNVKKALSFTGKNK